MRISATVKTAALGTAFALVGIGAGTASAMSDSEVSASLKMIQHDADAIAAGKYAGKGLQAPAHEIGAEWYKVEPILAKNGSVLVETRMANASITTFSHSWQHSDKVRSAAKDVSSSVADLISATKTPAVPGDVASPSASGSPAASPAPSGSP